MPASAPNPLWVRVADAVLDGSIAAFAIWTVLYEGATAFGLAARGTGLVWLPLAGLALVGFVLHAVRVHRSGAPCGPVSSTEGARTGNGVHRIAVAVGGVFAVAAAALALLTQAWVSVWLTTLAACAVLLLAVALGPAVRRTASPSRRAPGRLSHLGAAGVVLALTVAMMFVLNPSSDDIFYVNRSVWVVEHGTFSLRDTMFGAETYAATYGAPPIHSIEGLVGAMALLLGVPAASFAYLVLQPVGCLLAGWATWRLVRAWAPRRALLVLAGAVLFALFSATGTVGDFSYARMWQGKVLAFAVLLPVAWVYLTGLVRAGSRRTAWWSLAMLTVCGLAFVGLTATAVLLAPAFSAAALVAAVVLPERRRRLAAGAVAFSAVPVLAALAVLALAEEAGAGTSGAPRVERVVGRVLGEDPWVAAIAVLALGLAPLLARGGAGRVVAGAAAFTSLVLLVPTVLDVLGAVTGSGPVLYRLLMVAPIPVLVGLLLAAPAPSVVPPRLRGTMPVVCTAALTAALVLGGTAPWSPQVGARWTDEPMWKWPPASVSDARAVLGLQPGSGPVLLPRQQMKTLPLLTTQTFAVSPRNYYLRSLDEPRRRHRARRLLGHMMAGSGAEVPPQERVAKALQVLDVTLVCAHPHRDDLLAVFRESGYRDPTTAGRLTCLRRA